MSSRKINVLVTGVGGGGVGEQILKALKMGKLKYRIIGTDVTPTSKGLYEVDKGYVVPLATHKDYIPRLLEICEDEKVSVVIPGSEPELYKMSDCRVEFSSAKIMTLINDAQVLSLCSNKWATYNFLVAKGYNCPKSVLVNPTAGKAVDGKLDISFPVIVKPMSSSSGSSNVFIAQDREELRFFIGFLAGQNITSLIQEYVGSYLEEYTVGVLTDMFSGKMIGSIALKRFTMSALSNRIKVKRKCSSDVEPDILVVSSGVSQGMIDDYPEVRAQCEKIALQIGSKGPLNIQCRKVGAYIYPFEINPRLSGTTSLRAMVGFNEPDVMIRKHLVGEPINDITYSRGWIARGLSECHIPLEKIMSD